MIVDQPRGLRGVIEIFGDIHDPRFEASHIVSFTLPYPLLYAGKPVHTTRCHRLAVDNFIAVFEDIKAAGLDELATEYCGIYARRPIRGQALFPSLHSFGIAIDLCCSQFPLGSLLRQDQRIIDIFAKHCFSYGGDFVRRKDGMHYQLSDLSY